MKEKIKMIAKLLLTYFWNGFKVMRFTSFGKNSSIMKGLKVNNPQGITILRNVRIGAYARLSCYSSKTQMGTITIEDGCYICDYFSVLTAADVLIRNDTLVASYVTILGENHGINPECGLKYGLQDLVGDNVLVEDHCWIGEKVIILPGVTIGSYSVIGAGSVVTHDIPSYSVAAGNPARVIKKYDFTQKAWIKV